MPITRSLTADLKVGHDCLESRCAVSLDGYILNPDAYRREMGDSPDLPEGFNIAEGERVPNGQDPNPDEWEVRGSTIIAKRVS